MGIGLATVVGAVSAAALTGAAGVLIPIFLVPDSNLAPIIGFILAPPAGILGALLGMVIGRLRCSSLMAGVLGMGTGVLAGVILIVVSSGDDAHPGIGVNLFYILSLTFIFGVSGVVTQRLSIPRKV